MDSTGLSEVIGSWKIIAISRPRICRIASSESARRSRPLKRTRPPTMRPAGGATRRMMLSALTLLPQPDSPTRATVSPSPTSHETLSAARTTPPRVTNSVVRFSTSRRTPTVRGSVAQRRRGSVVAARGREVRGRAGLERRVLAADRLGHARPPVLRGPPDAFAPDAPAQVGIGDQRRDAVGERLDVALGDEEAGHAVANRRHEAAHAGGDDGAPACHRLEGDHSERLVVRRQHGDVGGDVVRRDRKSTRLNSSHGYISYAVFCLKKKNKHT